MFNFDVPVLKRSSANPDISSNYYACFCGFNEIPNKHPNVAT